MSIPFGPMFHGIWHTFMSCWWLFGVLLGAKFGPRIVRGILLQRGGLR